MARLLFTAKDFGSLADPLDPSTTKKLEDLIGMPVQYMQQSHSNNVSVVSKIGLPQADTDSLISSSKEFALAVRVADCMPLLLYSKNLVAAVHVGRKGLLNEVALKTIEKMKTLSSEQITGVVGPHICGDCYEVDEQMATQIHQTHPATGGKKNHLNLFAGLKEQLAGIPVENMNICTMENQRYFSYRARKDDARQVGVIAL